MPLALLERFLLAWRTRIKSNRDTVSRLIAAATLLFERWAAAVFALCDNVHALERALAIGSALGKCSDIDRAFTLHNTRIGNGGRSMMMDKQRTYDYLDTYGISCGVTRYAVAYNMAEL